MARITVEDCLDNVDNRFQLVLVAAKRARQLSHGVEPLVDWENDKPTVVALREIAEDKVGPAILNEKPAPEPDETGIEEAIMEELEKAEMPAADATPPDESPAPAAE